MAPSHIMWRTTSGHKSNSNTPTQTVCTCPFGLKQIQMMAQRADANEPASAFCSCATHFRPRIRSGLRRRDARPCPPQSVPHWPSPLPSIDSHHTRPSPSSLLPSSGVQSARPRPHISPSSAPPQRPHTLTLVDCFRRRRSTPMSTPPHLLRHWQHR
jgi:hypothetical protein